MDTGLSSEKGWRDWSAAASGNEWKDAFYTFCKNDEKKTIVKKEGEANDEEEAPDTNASWKEVEWDEERAAASRALLEAEEKMSEDQSIQFEQNASQFWNTFYGKHNNRFFKARNYLPTRHPELVIDPIAELRAADDSGQGEPRRKIFMEIGCGTGSTLFPLLDLNHKAALAANREDLCPFFYAFDFSSEAVSLVIGNELYDEKLCKGFVCDVANEDLPEEVREDKVDIGMMVFVMSAISPEKMKDAAARLYRSLRPGGFILFRDYGQLDMTQMRFVAKKGRKIDDNFYARADGTRTFFFDLPSTQQLFSSVGFDVRDLRFDIREIKNRKRMISMYRVWVCAKLYKPLDPSSTSSSSSSSSSS